MASSASSSSSSRSSNTPGSQKSSRSTNTAASGSSPNDPMEGSSKSFDEQPAGSEMYQTSLHNRQSSKSSRHSSSGASAQTAGGNRDAEQSGTVGDPEEPEGEDDEYDDETIKPVSKRNSTHSHKNVHTECGRHSDDWLFAPLTDTVKSLLGKKEHK